MINGLLIGQVEDAIPHIRSLGYLTVREDQTFFLLPWTESAVGAEEIQKAFATEVGYVGYQLEYKETGNQGQQRYDIVKDSKRVAVMWTFPRKPYVYQGSSHDQA